MKLEEMVQELWAREKIKERVRSPLRLEEMLGMGYVS